MKHEFETLEGALCEYTYECVSPDCGSYYEEFTYGGTHWHIGVRDFYGHYTDTREVENQRKKEMDTVIEYLSVDICNAGPMG